MAGQGQGDAARRGFAGDVHFAQHHSARALGFVLAVGLRVTKAAQNESSRPLWHASLARGTFPTPAWQ